MQNQKHDLIITAKLEAPEEERKSSFSLFWNAFHSSRNFTIGLGIKMSAVEVVMSHDR